MIHNYHDLSTERTFPNLIPVTKIIEYGRGFLPPSLIYHYSQVMLKIDRTVNDHLIKLDNARQKEASTKKATP